MKTEEAKWGFNYRFHKSLMISDRQAPVPPSRAIIRVRKDHGLLPARCGITSDVLICTQRGEHANQGLPLTYLHFTSRVLANLPCDVSSEVTLSRSNTRK